ncbi:MAG: HNH endonuclease [Parabacteroides sp.]|nr:HNH endonuclease [Parabacteroides sp.]
MRINNLTCALSLLCIVMLSTLSCKKAVKEISELATKESTEKIAKGIVEESSEKTLKKLTRKEIKSLDWDDFLKMLRKEERINISEALSRLDGSMQKKIAKAIHDDYEFYSAVISSNTILDEFAVFTKNAPKASKDINLLKYFAKCRDLEWRFGVQNAVGDIVLREEGGFVKLLNKIDNSVIGGMRDGIILLKEPFKNGSNVINQGSLLKKTLIPNSVYKIKGSYGMSYLYHVDDMGRFSKIEAIGISADELMSNVIFAKENLNLGAEWTSKLRTVRQTSKGNDIKATLLLKYTDDNTTPLVAKADIIANNKKIISQSFENLDNYSKKAFTTADNSSLLDKLANRTGLSTKKKADLLGEMGLDEELAILIHSNPELNIKRWLNTRNPVDKNSVAKTANGRMVPNGQVYAGNIYYFNPHLNSGLKARLKNGGNINLKKNGSLTNEDLIKLDGLYPDGVPFSKDGYPDFTKVAFKDKNGQALRVDIGQLTGDSKKDISAAETLFQKMGYTWESGYTWHHLENSTSLIRVPSTIHQLIDHAGGMSTHAVQSTIKQAA